MTDTPKENRPRNGAGGRFLPGNPGGGRPRGVPNRVSRPAREWLAEKLDSDELRERLLAVIHEDPVALWKAWEWTHGRAPQAVDLAVTATNGVTPAQHAVHRRIQVFESLKIATARGIITLEKAHEIAETLE